VGDRRDGRSSEGTGVGTGVGVACGRADTDREPPGRPAPGPEESKERREPARPGANAYLVRNEGNDVEVRQQIASLQGREFDEHGQGDDVRPEAFQELARGCGRAAGRQQIVDDDDAIVLGQRVGMNLERVRAVLERVVLGECRERQFAGFRTGTKPAPSA